MKRMIENITGNYTSSASVVDGTLILSLPDAVSPIVWRMDLGQVRASAIEVRTNDDGTFTLALKTPRGDINDIARYDQRGRAVTALMAVTRAMEHAHGQIRPIANDMEAGAASRMLPVPVGPRRSVSRKPGSRNWLGAVAALAVVGFLFLFMMNMGPQPMKTSLNSTNPASGSAAAAQSGVPLSADDFLKGR